MDHFGSFWQRSQSTILTFTAVMVAAGVFTYFSHKRRLLRKELEDKIESAATGTPPTATPIPHTIKYHGKPFEDDFHWLSDPDNPKVLEYLHAENAYATWFFNNHTKYLQEKLYNEFLSHLVEEDQGVQSRRGEWIYYERSEPGKQYGIICRKFGSVEAPEEILLDENELAEGKTFFHLGSYRVSPDNTVLAYSIDTVGNERYVVRFRDMSTGLELPDQIFDQHISLEWSNDSKTIFFDRVDDQLRPFMIVSYTLGSKKERVVFVEKDPRFHISLKKRDRFMLIDTGSIMTTETWIIDADQPLIAPRVFHPRQFDVIYSVEFNASGKHFFVLCNADRHRNCTMYYTPIEATAKENWIEFLPYDQSVSLQGMCCFRSHVVIYGRQDFKPYIRVVKLNPHEEDTEDLAGRSHFLTFADPCYNCWIDPEGQNENSNILRLTFASLTIPDTTYDYNMDTRELIEVKRMPVKNYNPDNYRSEMLYTRASDGTKVAISLVYRKGLEKNSQNPCLMYGYGAYGSLTGGGFSVELLSLLDRGFVFALAHVRGSGDNGRIWYEEGKLLKKRNSMLDFVKCAEKLIREGYTSEEYLSLQGRSAGGLLVAAVLNIRPDLFKAALVGVPFVDCINTLMDPTYPLTVNEYEEWGNPIIRDAFEYISTYSPYDNVRSNTKYPSMFVVAGFHDARVRYWEPAKYVARLRNLEADGSFDQNCSDPSTILLHTQFSSGHFGSVGRYDNFTERAQEYAFLVYHLLPYEIPKSKVHLLFDEGYLPPHTTPRHLELAITKAGYVCQTYFVTPENVEETTEDIPQEEIVFLHCDLPPNSPPGSQHEVSRFIQEKFYHVTGALAEFIENTSWRSVQNKCLSAEGVSHMPSIRIEDTSELAHKLEAIEELGTPLMISVDSVRKFREEAAFMVASSTAEAARKIGDILRKHGPVVFQRLVVGREFTVAVTHEHRVYTPCEKIPSSFGTNAFFNDDQTNNNNNNNNNNGSNNSNNNNSDNNEEENSSSSNTHQPKLIATSNNSIPFHMTNSIDSSPGLESGEHQTSQQTSQQQQQPHKDSSPQAPTKVVKTNSSNNVHGTLTRQRSTTSMKTEQQQESMEVTHSPHSTTTTHENQDQSSSSQSTQQTSQEDEQQQQEEIDTINNPIHSGRKTVRGVDLGKEAELFLRLQQVAIAGYRAVKGSGYARVEIVEEESTGVLYVLDVVPHCAITEDSYFQTSTKQSGGVPKLFDSLILDASSEN